METAPKTTETTKTTKTTETTEKKEVKDSFRIPFGELRKYELAEASKKSSEFSLTKNRQELLKVPAAYRNIKENFKKAEKELSSLKKDFFTSFEKEIEKSGNIKGIISSIDKQWQENKAIQKNIENNKDKKFLKNLKDSEKRLRLLLSLVEEFIQKKENQDTEEAA